MKYLVSTIVAVFVFLSCESQPDEGIRIEDNVNWDTCVKIGERGFRVAQRDYFVPSATFWLQMELRDEFMQENDSFVLAMDDQFNYKLDLFSEWPSLIGEDNLDFHDTGKFVFTDFYYYIDENPTIYDLLSRSYTYQFVSDSGWVSEPISHSTSCSYYNFSYDRKINETDSIQLLFFPEKL